MDLVASKRVRSSTRRIVTSSISNARELLAKETINSDDEAKLKGISTLLQDKLGKLEELDTKIISICEEEEVDAETIASNEYETSIYTSLAEIEGGLKKLCVHTHDGSTESYRSSSRTSSPVQSETSDRPRARQRHIRRPKLEIEHFDGNPIDYPSFIDSFRSSVHSDQELNDVDKFAYLKSYLKGRALNTVKGLAMTEANYKEAMELLEKRYGDKKALVSNFMHQIMSLKPVHDEHDTAKLRDLYDNLEMCARNLKSLGITSESFAPVVIPTILTKIPECMEREIKKATRETNWDFEEILVLLNNEISTNEQCLFTSKSIREKRTRANNDEGRRPSSGTSLHGALQGAQLPKKDWCVYCKQGHKPWDCEKVVDVAERRELLKKGNRCYNCLGKGHASHQCKSKYRCYHCKERHNSSICEKEKDAAADNNEPNPEVNNISLLDEESDDEGDTDVVLLKTAYCEISSQQQQPMTMNHGRLLFDDCSQKSYISKEFAEKLGLKAIHRRAVIINGTCATSTRKMCDVVEFYVQIDEAPHQIKVKARVLDQICHPIPLQPVRSCLQNYRHLKGLKIADFHRDNDTLEIDVLIGGDFYYTFMEDRVIRGGKGEPTAVKSKVGWLLSGPVRERSIISHFSNLSTITTLNSAQIEGPVSDLNDGISKFWDLDTVGIRNSENPVSEKFLDEIKFDEIDRKYEVKLPWKPSQESIPNNYENAARSLKYQITSMKKNPEKLRNYHRIITEQLRNRIVEKCEVSTPNSKNPRTHVLPHHGVERPESESTPLRIVYNASSKSKNSKSLNDLLYKGPSLTPHLFDVLVRFRVHLVALIGDISKAFLNIKVAEKDRDALRFLWVDDPFKEDPEIIELRFTRVLFGLNCSPFLLNGTLRHHLMKYTNDHEELILQIIRSLYVDDFTGGAPDTEKASEVHRNLVQLLAEGGFPVCKFVTNDPELRKIIGVESKAVKVLGLAWDPDTDTIYFDFRAITAPKDPTKRVMACVLMLIFDPLGLVGPIIMPIKLMLQETWKLKLSWDDPLPELIQKRWFEWCESVKNTREIRFPRCYLAEKTVECKLIGFCDASTKAFAAVVYLRAVYASGQVSSRIIGSKSRVAPMKITEKSADNDEVTVPILELLGCHILASFVETIEKALGKEIEIKGKEFWTDSTINLWRIRAVQNQYETFEENRLAHIRKKTDTLAWFYVPTDLNPADIPSRGCSPTELSNNALWIHGPYFVLLGDDFDRESFEKALKTRAEGNAADDPRLKKKKSTNVRENAMLNTENPGNIDSSTPNSGNTEISASSSKQPAKCCLNLSKIINVAGNLSLQRLLNVTSHVLDFVYRNPKFPTPKSEPHSLDDALKLWIRNEQSLFSKSEEFRKTEANLRLYVEDGIMRCRGRLSNSDLPYDTKFPIFIPRQSPLAVLLVVQAHEAVFHRKEGATMTQVRTNYWIPQCRKLVRRILPKCYLCKRMESLAMSLPPAPPLPHYRVECAPAFTNIGFDHMGPIYVYDIYKKEDAYKAYVALFTCCTTRMIHLELQPALDAAPCIRALERTFRRVGYPRRVISDNHKTFRSKGLRSYARRNSIDWRYILELAPHWGGFYERLNRLVKTALRKIIWKSKLNYEEIETILIQIEYVLNSRPLCYVDDTELSEPITPFHLMFGDNIAKRKVACRPAELPKNDTNPKVRINQINAHLEHFQKRFTAEYITGLRERDAKLKKSNSNTQLKVGDVVMINQKHTARSEWPLGRVTRLITSSDSTVRGVELKTSSGTINRPINKLHPLELS